MQIKIPSRVTEIAKRYVDWCNIVVYQWGRLEIRRVDILLAIGFVTCIGWYWTMYGWKSAILGGILYIFFAMVALWF